MVRRELLEAKDEAARLLAEAESKAKERLDSLVQAEAQAVSDAKVRGYQEGLAEAAARVVGSIRREQHALDSSTERIVALARLLAERILGRALISDDRALSDMAHTLLSEVRGARRLTLRVNPEDVAVVEHAVSAGNALVRVTVEGSPELKRGDFHLATDMGSLEGALGSRLDLLAQKLREGLGP